MGRITLGTQESGVAASTYWLHARVFIERWVHHPLRMASVMPSSRQLAELVVDQLPARCARVAELGAGTGALTRAMLARGIQPENLLLVEIDERLAALLRMEFSRVRVTCADARDLGRLVHNSKALAAGEVDAVVSGIGMLTMRQALRAEILQAAFAVLGKDGCFVQFTYGPTSPVSARTLAALGLCGRRAGVALHNFPPASVFVYRRR